MSKGLIRRDVLKGLGATAAAGLVGCNGDNPPPSGPPEHVEGRIDHVIVLMMENRTFDHVFGALSLHEGRDDVDGLTADMANPDLDGVLHPVVPAPFPCVHPDPPHGWGTSRTQLDGGTNQGFVRTYQQSKGLGAPPENVMGYLSRAQQPVSYAVADHYAICNRWFSSVLTSTWPNRLYLHGAQSQGQQGNTFPDGKLFTMRTIWDQLDEAGIDWRYYFTDLPMTALFGRLDDPPNFIERFYEDALAGDLPPVVMVEPGAAYNDDHPPNHPLLGQAFIGSVIAALQQSPVWERCLFLCAYDEGGGFFDHVPPGTVPDDRADEGFDQLGFRVPGFAVGPYVKERYVSDVQFDHTSILRTIQELHGLPPLTARDAAAEPLWDLLDLDRLERNDPRPPVAPPTIELTRDEIEAQCADNGWRSGQPELQDHVQRTAPWLDRTRELPRIGRDLARWAELLGVVRLK